MAGLTLDQALSQLSNITSTGSQFKQDFINLLRQVDLTTRQAIDPRTGNVVGPPINQSNSRNTILYSGMIGDTHSSEYALEIARSGLANDFQPYRIIDGTPAHLFLTDPDVKDILNIKLGGVNGTNWLNQADINSPWGAISDQFVRTSPNETNVITIVPNYDKTRVFALAETTGVMETPTISKMNGVDIAPIKTAYSSTLSSEGSVAARELVGGAASMSFANNQFKTDGIKLYDIFDANGVRLGPSTSTSLVPPGGYARTLNPISGLMDDLASGNPTRVALGTTAANALMRAANIVGVGLGAALVVGNALNVAKQAAAQLESGDARGAANTLSNFWVPLLGGTALAVPAGEAAAAALAAAELGGALGVAAGIAVPLAASLAAFTVGAALTVAAWNAGANLVGPWLGIDIPHLDPLSIPFDPIVLDLNGDGINLISVSSSKTYFDIDNDAFKEKVGWVSPLDGLLVRDLNNNNLIDNGLELIGTNTTDAYTILRGQDNNSDGVLNASDTIWGQLKIWQDANSNGVTDAGELFSLSSKGITSIGLADTAVNKEIGGNVIYSSSNFIINGVSAKTSAVFFGSAQSQTQFVYPNNYVANPDTKFLPAFLGGGNIAPIGYAMTTNSALLTQVKALVNSAGTLSFNSLRTEVEKILFKWAGVENAIVGSRGPSVDAKHVGFYEALSGVTLPAYAPPIIETHYQALLDQYTTLFASQSYSSYILLNPNSLGTLQANSHNYKYMSGITVNPLNDGILIDCKTFASNIVFSIKKINADPVVAVKNYMLTQQIINPLTAFKLALSNDVNSIMSQLLFGFDQSAPDISKTSAAIALMLTLDGTSADSNRSVGTTSANTYTFASGQTTYFGDAGNDVISGNSNNNYLVGGLGNDTLSGTTGSDTYIYAKGDGIDTINEASSYNSDSDKLLITGYSSNQAYLSRIYDTFGNITENLKVSFIDNPNDTIYCGSVDDLFGAGLETIQFIDKNYTRSDIRKLLISQTQTSNNDTVYGFRVDDVIQGGKGDDLLIGAGGSDTYIYNNGDGADTINEASSYNTDSDKLIISGYNSLQTFFKREKDINGNITDNVTINFTGIQSDSIKIGSIDDQFGGGLEFVQMSDKSYTRSDIRSLLISQSQTNGNDTIYGFRENETFQGGKGDDLLIGSSGSDTYLYNNGDGADTINDASSYNADSDKVIVSGYTSTQATFRRGKGTANSYNGDVWITFNGNTFDSINIGSIDDQFGSGMELIQFSDKTYSRAEILAIVNAKTSLDQTVSNNNYTANFSQSNINFTISGSNDTITLSGANNLVWVYGNTNTINTNSNILLLETNLANETINGNSNKIITKNKDISFTLIGANNSISLNGTSVANVWGNGNTVSGTSSDTIQLGTGTGEIANISNGTVTFFDGANAVINGNSNTINFWGSNISATAVGNIGGNSIIMTGTNNSINSNYSNIYLEHGSSTYNISGLTNTIFMDFSGITLNTSNSSINVAVNSASETIIGSGNSIYAASLGDNLSIGGNGVNGNANVIDINGGNISLISNSNTTIQGNNNIISMASLCQVNTWGSSNNVTGISGSKVLFGNGNNNIANVSSGTVTLYDNSNVTINGISNTINLWGSNIVASIIGSTGGNNIYLTGTNNSATATKSNFFLEQASSTYSISGSANVITMDYSGNNLTTNNAVINISPTNATETIIGNGNTINLNANGQTLNSSNSNVKFGSLTKNATITGNNNNITATGSGNIITVHGTGDVINTSNSTIYKGNTSTITVNGTGNTIVTLGVAPIIFDLNNDGLQLTSVKNSNIASMSSNGALTRLGWVGPRNGILVTDRNGDKDYASISDISFVNDLAGAKTDLEGLAGWDSNFDGNISENDANWKKLQIWIDSNSDGISQYGEVNSLEQMGISSISLKRNLTGNNGFYSVESYASAISSFKKRDGTDGNIYDVTLSQEVIQSNGWQNLLGNNWAKLDSGKIRQLDQFGSLVGNESLDYKTIGDKQTKTINIKDKNIIINTADDNNNAPIIKALKNNFDEISNNKSNIFSHVREKNNEDIEYTSVYHQVDEEWWSNHNSLTNTVNDFDDFSNSVNKSVENHIIFSQNDASTIQRHLILRQAMASFEAEKSSPAIFTRTGKLDSFSTLVSSVSETKKFKEHSLHSIYKH